MSHVCCIRFEGSHLQRHYWHANLLCALFTEHSSSSSKCTIAATQHCVKLQACSCRLQSGILAAVKLAKFGTAEAHMLQREAKAYRHCKQLQYQVLPGALAAGPTIDGTAYLLATCLLPVVGFSDCSSAKYQALHAVKALHGLRVLHGDIRESNVLCISEAKQTCKITLIDLGQSRLCSPESAFQQELLQTQQLFT